jgi:prepilin-type N-terminal cleavage/methylation domain-containing protein
MTRQRGVGFIELLVAVTILTVLLAILAHMLGVLAHQRRGAARQLLAVEEVANIMERLAAMDYRELRPDQPPKLTLSAAARRSLPQAKLTIEVTREDTALPGKRIRVELTWENRAGQAVRPVGLTSWRYEP